MAMEGRTGTLGGGVVVTHNPCLYAFCMYLCMCVRKIRSCMTGGSREPIGVMHSFRGNCQHQSATTASFVRLKEIALQHDVSLCLWHTPLLFLRFRVEGGKCATHATVSCL